MYFLITGGAGFIGHHLANRLNRMGHSVRVIDDLTTGDPYRLDADIHFTRGDANDVPKLWRLLNKVDCVYHLAARVSVPESVLYPRDYNATNVGGTVAVMEAIRDAGARRVVFASSGAIYGEQKQQPVNESLPPNPSSPYAVSKLAAEYYVKTIGMLWGIETVCLRVFNTYGPGQGILPAHAPVIPKFMQQLLGKGSVIIHSDGEQTRDFIYVDDVVDALIAAASMENVDHQAINVGTGVETSIGQLVTIIEEVVGKTAQVLYVPSESQGVRRLVADISLAKRTINFQPSFDLRAGLEHLLNKEQAFQKLRANAP